LKIFYSFLIVFASAVLYFIPITAGVHDFRTDLKEDSFYVSTNGAITTGNVTLIKALYQDDTSSVQLTSDQAVDTPVVAGYTTATRLLDISGLAVSYNRTLTASYDWDALGGSGAVNAFLDKVAWIWLLCVIAFAPAALAAVWMGKA
jgi:hypothetical protein